jgi:PIN domain nuclease of toxin-antitoxin system
MILLDTHAWVWLALEPRRLSGAATHAIKEATRTGGVAIASISLWEIGLMIVRGRLIPEGPAESWLDGLVDRTHVLVREITPSVAILATHFPTEFSGDPADRLIAATAHAEGLPLVTKDAKLRASHVVRTIW